MFLHVLTDGNCHEKGPAKSISLLCPPISQYMLFLPGSPLVGVQFPLDWPWFLPFRHVLILSRNDCLILNGSLQIISDKRVRKTTRNTWLALSREACLGRKSNGQRHGRCRSAGLLN